MPPATIVPKATIAAENFQREMDIDKFLAI